MVWPRVWTLLIAAGSAAVIGWLVVLMSRYPEVGVLDTVVVIALSLPAIVLGLVIALKRPRNRIAPLLALVGAMLVLVVGLGDEYGAIALLDPAAAPAWTPWAMSARAGSWVLLYLPTALLLLLFPDGRLPSRGWRWAPVTVVLVTALFLVVAGGTPADPPFDVFPPAYAVPPALGAVAVGLVGVFLVLLVACAAAMIVRYRRSASTVARAQVRWFALGSMILPLTLLLCWLSYLLFDVPDLVMIGIGLSALAIPAVTTIALLRHDLYDVDRAFSATVAYSLVTAVLLAVFGGAEAVAGVLLGRESPVAAAVATAVCALALAPLRRRLTDRVDRRLYPLRRSVRAALATLQARIDTGLARPEDLPETLRTALRDPGLRVGYVLPGRAGLVDGQCRPVPGGVAEIPVLVSGTQVGALLPDGGPAPRELLREAAGGSALMVEVIRSRLELTEALREVAESRARLLQAGYRERRRLERDLHDGAQQRLVSLGMAIRLAQRRLESGHDEDVHGLLDQAVAELGTAVAELRAIAQGLRPLDLDSGLGPAIRSLTTALPIPVRLEVLTEAVPDEVATTAYYVASEALANVVKHSDAATVDIRVERAADQVVIRVSDDGRGGAVARPGSGLAGLVDRVAAAGGRLSVGPAVPGLGTTVEAVLPCAP